MTPSSPALSFVVPAFNEEDRLAASLELMLDFACHRRVHCQLIVVDDGSSDRTGEVVRGFQQSLRERTALRCECNAVCYQRPHSGKGSALRFGTLRASAPVIFWVDADFPYSRDFLERALEYLGEGDDAVIGARDLPGSYQDPSLSRARRVLGRLLSHLIRVLLPIRIFDTQCGFKAFRAEPLLKALAFSEQRGFALDIEILLLLRLWDLNIQRLPVKLIRHHGSKVRLWRDGWRMLVSLLEISANLARGAYPENFPPTVTTVAVCPSCGAERSRFLGWSRQRRFCQCRSCKSVYEKPLVIPRQLE